MFCIEPYSVRESRIHIRRLRDLLITMLEPNAFNATDNLSLSYCSAITEIDIEEEALKNLKEANSAKSATDLLPPSWATLENGESPLLGPLVIQNNDAQVSMKGFLFVFLIYQYCFLNAYIIYT